MSPPISFSLPCLFSFFSPEVELGLGIARPEEEIPLPSRPFVRSVKVSLSPLRCKTEPACLPEHDISFLSVATLKNGSHRSVCSSSSFFAISVLPLST